MIKDTMRHIKKIFTNIGIALQLVYIEKERCKYQREKKNFMYLMHGTKPKYESSIKRQGLKVSSYGKRSKEEGDVIWGKPCIWLANIYDEGNRVGYGGMGLPKDVKYILVKVYTDPKYLEFISGAYRYFKDVPPKDLIWEDDKRFLKIVNNSKCIERVGQNKWQK